MELNIIDFGMTENDTIYDQMIEQSIDTEFTLPDYCRNIERILKCCAKPRISSKTVSGTQMTIEGNVEITLIYVAADEHIDSFNYVYPYSKIVSVNQDIEYANVNVKAKSNYINCRAISQRKVEIHGAIGLATKVTARKTTGIISDIGCEDIKQLKGTTDATISLGRAQKYLVIEDELEIGQGKPAVRSIIRTDATAIISDCKIISNKAVVKGELLVNALYCPESDERPQFFEGNIPYSQILDIEELNDECECDVTVEVVQIELKPRTGLSGETRSISLESKLCVSVNAYCNNQIPVIYDAFSVKYESEAKTQDICFERIIDKINERYLCKKNLEFTEGSLDSIIDLWCETQVMGSKIEENKIIIKGVAYICILAYDANNIPVYYERPVDFEYSYEPERIPSFIKCDPIVDVVSSSYTSLGSDKIEVRIELRINATVFDISSVSVVTDVIVDESSMRKKEENIALVIYYAQSGEKIWEIARKYNTSPDEIREINSIEGDVVENNNMLLIPC